MKKVLLSQAKVAIVDDDVFPGVAQFRWAYRAEKNGNQGYAVRHVKKDGKDRLSYLHREIVKAPPGYEVIFRNHDRLDCRRENLLIVTKKEARQHHRVRSDSGTGVKGVRYHQDTRTWSAVMYRNGDYICLGTYNTRDEAAAAYEEEIRRENPNLHLAPEKIDPASIPDSANRSEDCPGNSQAA